MDRKHKNKDRVLTQPGRTEENRAALPITIPYTISEKPYDQGLEPQTVKVRSQNRGAFNMTLDTYNGSKTVVQNVFANRIKRLAITRIHAKITIPNVTNYNNTFVYNTGAGDQQITIPVGYYSTPTAFANAVAAQTLAVGNQLVPTLTAGTSDVFQWQTSTGTVFITSTPGFSNTAMDRPYGLGFLSGRMGTNLLRQTQFTTITPAFGIRYFDICSRTLTMDTKTQNNDLTTPPGFLHRVYLTSIQPHIIDIELTEPRNWVNVDNRPLDNVDLYIVPDQQIDFTTSEIGFVFPSNIKIDVGFVSEI